MLKNEILGELYLRLKKGTVLPIDGKNVQYNKLFNWSEDTHVLDTVDYVLLDYNLIDNKGNIIEVDTIDADEPNAYITAFKENNEVVITTNNGTVIEGYKLLGNFDNNTLLDIRGTDERHSEENNYEGSTLDLYINTNTLTTNFEII